MLEITVPSVENCWDESRQEFIHTKEQVLRLEHSLVSVSKWEAKWCKPFLSKDGKSAEEIMDYIRCMTLTQNVSPDVYRCLTDENFRAVNQYIDAPMTATWFSGEASGRPGREQVTSELVYYWMIAFNIPFECQKWHLNRLLTLIRVCNIKNQPAKKMGRREIMSRNAALNAARKQKLNTKG
ncbi:hypothetical protein AALC25_00085 [Lachnospiraceae bacterium 29-84]